VPTQVLANLIRVLHELDSSNGALLPMMQFNDEPPLQGFFTSIGGKKPEWCGAVGTDPVFTQIRAIGESLERYCIANHNEKKVIYGTESEIPNSLSLEQFVDQQSVEKDYHLPVCGKKESIGWYPVKNIQGEEFYAPQQVVTYAGGDEPFIWDKNTNGLACHSTEEKAMFSALSELVERDAFLIRYHASRKAPRVNIQGHEELNNLLQLLKRYRLETEVYDLDLGFGIPLYMTILLDQTGHTPHIALGFGTSEIGIDAVRKSIFEAVQIRTYHRSLDEEEREQNMSAIDARALLYNAATKKSLAHMLDDEAEFQEIKDLEGNIGDFMASFPHELHFADLTLPGMAGFKVIKAVCPDLVNLYFDDRAAPLKNPRLLEAAGENPLHLISHPFA